MNRLITALFALSLTNMAWAEDVDPNVEEDIKAFHNAPEKVDTPSIEIDPLDEEEGFEMDLSTPVVTTVENPESELSTTTTVSTELPEDGEPVVDPSATNLDWSLDLSEDLEVGDTVLTTEEAPKSEPANLDYLEE